MSNSQRLASQMNFRKPHTRIRRQLFFVALILAVSLIATEAFVTLPSHVPRKLTPPALAVASSNKKNGRRRGGDKPVKKKNKPRQTILQAKGKQAPSKPPRPPPDLTHYSVNASPRVNDERLNAAIGCPHFGQCSGCLVDNHVASTPVLDSAALYFSSTAVRQHRVDVKRQGLPWAVEQANDGWMQVLVPSAVTQWRTQAKLAVAPSASRWEPGCRLGLYRRGSHEVLPIPDCAVHHPSINRAVQIIEKCTAKVGTSAYSRTTMEGGLRYVQCQVERTTGRVCLTLVWHAAQLKEAQPALSRLVKALQAADSNLWHSIWCNCNDGIGNAIFHRNAQRWHRLVGPEYLREPLPTVGNERAPGWLYFTPTTFRQGNLDGFSVLAADVAQAVPAGSKVCELYAGVGVLGLTALAHHADREPLVWLRCSDENPANPRCFQRAVESMSPSVASNNPKRGTAKNSAETEGLTLAQLAKFLEQGEDAFPDEPSGPKTNYMVASAAHALRSGQALGANVLIVDPPRKGLEDAVLDELCKPFNPDQPYVESASLLPMDDDRVHWANDVRTLIYVSCGFDALARDMERLLTSRAGWELESATGYVLFPGSDHVETVCIVQRQ